MGTSYVEKGDEFLTDKRINPKLKLVLFLVVFIAVVVAVRGAGLDEYLSTQRLGALLGSMGVWAPVVFVLIYAAAMMLGLPGTVFTVVGGLAFGKWYGTILNVVGATIGASGAFWVARLIVKESLSKKLKGQKWFDKFDTGLKENGISYMLFVRLVPLFPFNGLNFGSGITGVSFRDYFIGTAIGIIPATFVFTNAAAEIGESAAAGFKLTGGMISALLLLGVFSLIPVLIKRRLDKKSTGNGNPGD
ncbi:MAG: TVP38/TMEM64 family protein [bacterium]|nr:MAG: TVP38/TMEM64 family protein [bacterium]